jgi:O-6-methylguanine DNA methyltransferase
MAIAQRQAAQRAEAQPPPPAVVEPIRVLFGSPVGPLGIELLGEAVSRVVFSPAGRERRSFEPLGRLKRSDHLDEILGRLSEYFAGVRKNPGVEFTLGPSGLDSFARRVLRETCRVPYGKTRTYQMIAEAAGRPDAYRQALSILQLNPIPILVPCHRVVAKSGLGSYIGGIKRKQWLLRHEALHAEAL